MHVWTPLVAALSLASTALAAPKERREDGIYLHFKPGEPVKWEGGRPDMGNKPYMGELPTGNISDYPGFECKHYFHALKSDYILRGSRWGLDEEELKKIISKVGFPIRWDYIKKEYDGVPGFEASWQFGVKRAKATEKTLNKHLGIHGHLYGGVKCPGVKNDEFYHKYWDFHFAGHDRKD